MLTALLCSAPASKNILATCAAREALLEDRPVWGSQLQEPCRISVTCVAKMPAPLFSDLMPSTHAENNS
eukprot:6086844-Lingulodinium_polyedra.AAC.1